MTSATSARVGSGRTSAKSPPAGFTSRSAIVGRAIRHAEVRPEAPPGLRRRTCSSDLRALTHHSTLRLERASGGRDFIAVPRDGLDPRVDAARGADGRDRRPSASGRLRFRAGRDAGCARSSARSWDDDAHRPGSAIGPTLGAPGTQVYAGGHLRRDRRADRRSSAAGAGTRRDHMDMLVGPRAGQPELFHVVSYGPDPRAAARGDRSRRPAAGGDGARRAKQGAIQCRDDRRDTAVLTTPARRQVTVAVDNLCYRW